MELIKNYLTQTKPEDAIFWCIALTFLLLPTGTAPPLIGIGLGIAVWLFSPGFINAVPIMKQPWFRPVILFLVLPWIGLIYSQNPNLGMDYAMKTKYWIALFVVAGCSMDEKRVFILVSSLWTGLAAGAILALVQFAGFMTPVNELFLGFGIVHTLVSMYLIIGILMAAFYFKKAEKKSYKGLLFFLILLFLFHLTVLKGRSGYLIFILMAPLVAKDLMSGFSKKIKIGVGVLLILSIFISPVVRNTVSDTIQGLKENREKALRGEDIETMPRFYILKEALIVIKQHPFMGIGTGSLTEITRPKGHELAHPHNNFLYMGVSFGIIGIISGCWLFWNMFIRSWRSRETPLGYFVFSTCLVLFLGGMFDTQILNTGTLLMLSMTYGFLHHLPGDKTRRA